MVHESLPSSLTDMKSGRMGACWLRQMGGIDEAALERLQLIVEMTKHIQVRAARDASSSASASELAMYTPAFLWLLRDFYLDLEDKMGNPITPSDYLESALAPVPGDSVSVQSKNTIRSSIKSLFPSRDCFALVRASSGASLSFPPISPPHRLLVFSLAASCVR
jgi:hypothetical protein